MFSGIIEKQAKILDKKWWKFVIENHFWEELKLWQSIAHDWACMTIESYDTNSYTVFVMEESLEKTNFGTKNIGDSFNIERCLQVGDRIDGHFVSWHIDTTGVVEHLEYKEDGSLIIKIWFDSNNSHFIIDKWSITINGVSLTIVSRREWYLSVSIIPLTQDWTNLWTLQIGSTVNLEFDMLGKYIQNLPK